MHIIIQRNHINHLGFLLSGNRQQFVNRLIEKVRPHHHLHLHILFHVQIAARNPVDRSRRSTPCFIINIIPKHQPPLPAQTDSVGVPKQFKLISASKPSTTRKGREAFDLGKDRQRFISQSMLCVVATTYN